MPLFRISRSNAASFILVTLAMSFPAAAAPVSGSPFSNAKMAADALETAPGKAILSGNAVFEQGGFDLHAAKITLIGASSGPELASGHFNTLIAEGAAVLRVSKAEQQALGGRAKFDAQRIVVNGDAVVFTGERVTMSLAAVFIEPTTATRGVTTTMSTRPKSSIVRSNTFSSAAGSLTSADKASTLAH